MLYLYIYIYISGEISSYHGILYGHLDFDRGFIKCGLQYHKTFLLHYQHNSYVAIAMNCGNAIMS